MHFIQPPLTSSLLRPTNFLNIAPEMKIREEYFEQIPHEWTKQGNRTNCGTGSAYYR
jgi:hypothetical protein